MPGKLNLLQMELCFFALFQDNEIKRLLFQMPHAHFDVSSFVAKHIRGIIFSGVLRVEEFCFYMSFFSPFPSRRVIVRIVGERLEIPNPTWEKPKMEGDGRQTLFDKICFGCV